MEGTKRKPWRAVSEEEVRKIVRDKCAKCGYRTTVSGIVCCNYICVTGHSRGVDPRDCTYYKKRKDAERRDKNAYNPYF